MFIYECIKILFYKCFIYSSYVSSLDATVINNFKKGQLYLGNHKCLIFTKVEMWFNRFLPTLLKNKCDLLGNGKWKYEM